MKKLSFVLILLLMATGLFAQVRPGALNSETDVLKFADSVMSMIRKNKIHQAFDELKAVWPIPEGEIQELEDLTVEQLGGVEERFGKVVSYQLIDQKDLKDTFIKIVYVLKYEYHITRWIFIFYNPKDSWMLNNFKWDDQIDELF